MNILTKAVRMCFGEKEILKGIDFQLNHGECFGIIGPNGSGKSTFLKCIYRVMKPTSGNIYLNNRPIETYSYRESAKNLAVVAQQNYYNFDFSVLEVVLMGRSPHKRLMESDNAEDYRISEESLRKVGMYEFMHRSFSTLSGGEQQRVILARALAQQTECLVLDEPTNHLDIKYQLQIMDIVRALDVTVIAAFHDLNIAATYCDRLMAIKEGAVVGIGTPEKLLTEKFIYETYDVKSRVLLDESTNRPFIRYLPKTTKR